MDNAKCHVGSKDDMELIAEAIRKIRNAVY